MADFYNPHTKLPYSNKNFLRILDFYLFHCPVTTKSTIKKEAVYKKVSQRAITFEEKGWVGGRLTALHNEMLKHIEHKDVNSAEEVASAWEELERTSTNRDFYCDRVVYCNTIGKTKSLYYTIRNAFAHGSFEILNVKGKYIYFFETEKNGEMRSKIRLKEKTLLSWLTLFERGYTPKEKKRSTKTKAGCAI